ncbi:peroxiredoxin-like family protein [Spirulina major CS-329]|nr:MULTISPECIES: peroxiredoxin-like family protein [Spirulina]MDB9493578.1 peroxiredoxin-like family protein [Spirulina subsalsa CS-330]MDB9502219.1 peroxiredoxin-like family protein [Spirulina major CS-329]
MVSLPPIDSYELLRQTARIRVSDGVLLPVLRGTETAEQTLIVIWPQLGDFDSIEYATWIQRDRAHFHHANIAVRAVGIGDRNSGQRFCDYTGFPAAELFVDPEAQLHRDLNLYPGLTFKIPGLSPGQNAWLNLLLMCAGIGSPGTLREVWRGYWGDRHGPQLIHDDEQVNAPPLPSFQGSVFNLAGGNGFQRPFELATVRLRNMVEVLSHWRTYVPDPSYLPQRGATFLFSAAGELCYEYRDRGILGYAAEMRRPLSFLIPTQGPAGNR